MTQRTRQKKFKSLCESHVRINDLYQFYIYEAMTFNLVTDRNVSTFLDTRSFMMFRKTCRVHYDDAEAWRLRTRGVLIRVAKLNDKQTLGLNYLMKYALQFQAPIGSAEWFQNIVNWLDYKSSIKIVHSFMFHSRPSLMFLLDFAQLSPGPRMYWQRLWCRYERVYKKRQWDYENTRLDDKPYKKRRVLCY